MTQEQWGALRDTLCETIGENNFKTWIEPLRFDGCENGIATFRAPTNFMGNYVSQNFGDVMLSHMNAISGDVRRINFRVMQSANERGAPNPAASADGGGAAVPKTAASSGGQSTESASGSASSDRSDLLPGAPLDQRYTFDSFVVGKPNELAHAAARRVAEGGPVTFNPLFLYGGVGLGKTHLMHAIAWELRAKNPELNVLYLSAEQFMYRFVQALRDRSMMDFKSIFRSVDVLMVDDVQFIAGKDTTQEEFFHTFNALVDQNKQIIISADRAPADIKDLENRIKSRLQSGLVVDLHPTDYELRLGILQTKVEQQRAALSRREDRERRARIPCPPHLQQRPRSRRGADPSLRLRLARRPRDRPGPDAGMPGGRSARKRAQDLDRGDPAQGGASTTTSVSAT